jgi:autotransporter-associated beta strand protein
MSSWVENNKVPTAEDFIIVKNYGGVNWSVAFTNDETSWKTELGTPLTNTETVFKLNGHTWALTYDIHMGELSSGGGRIAFTNGTLRAPSLSFVPQVTNNLVLSMNSVTCEVGTLECGFTRATFEGGSLRVTNSFSVGKSGFRPATVTFDKGVVVYATNTLCVGDAVGATGELVNANGQLVHSSASGAFFVGRAGYGALTILGGSTYVQQVPCIGYTNTGVGVLTVAGGMNTFGTQGENKIDAGAFGRGTVLAYGGTNYTVGFNFGYNPGGYGEMVLTNGVWNLASYSWIGYYGKGVVTMSGGQITSGVPLCLGRGSGTGVVTVAGGTLEVPGEIRLGGNASSLGSLTVSGSGVLKAGYISEYTSDANSALRFDGGTLQATAAGALIRAVDDVRLTAKGLTVDTAGFAVSVLPTLQDASGEAGSLAKKGAGTLTLAGARAATGPVSVLAGTLVASNALAVAAGTSRIDGTLALTADNRLIVGAGAALAGTGAVARVTLRDTAAFARSRSDGALSALAVEDCAADNRVTVALTGYSLSDLKAASVPVVSVPATFIDSEKISVTLDGSASAPLKAKFIAAGSRQILTVVYSSGTVISVL